MSTDILYIISCDMSFIIVMIHRMQIKNKNKNPVPEGTCG